MIFGSTGCRLLPETPCKTATFRRRAPWIAPQEVAGSSPASSTPRTPATAGVLAFCRQIVSAEFHHANAEMAPNVMKLSRSPPILGALACLARRDAHTKAKHELLLAFFNKWVSIRSSYFASQLGGGLVRIYDGFAGPGVYLDGASGSPLILMRALCRKRARDRHPATRSSFVKGGSQRSVGSVARIQPGRKRPRLGIRPESRSDRTRGERERVRPGQQLSPDLVSQLDHPVRSRGHADEPHRAAR
jgi:hypothetical protein